MQGLLLLNFIVPFVMILVGYLIKKHPEWDMESHNGYNTPLRGNPRPIGTMHRALRRIFSSLWEKNWVSWRLF